MHVRNLDLNEIVLKTGGPRLCSHRQILVISRFLLCLAEMTELCGLTRKTKGYLRLFQCVSWRFWAISVPLLQMLFAHSSGTVE